MCLENYPGERFYGTATNSLRDQTAAYPLLIPFLKSLTQALMIPQGDDLELQDQEQETGKLFR